MKLSPEWTEHSPDLATCVLSAPMIRAEPTCECGIRERHKHCGGCGRLISKGDWDAPPIATYILPIGTKKATL